MSNFVDVNWLYQHLKNEDLIILDARYSQTDPDYGISSYKNGHIPSARYVDIATIVDEKSDYGGARPLPYPDRLAQTFGSLGIHNQSTVVIYDDGINPESARVWWMLKFIGHEKVYVLDGGFLQWKEEGYAIDADEPAIVKTHYDASPRWDLALKKDEVVQIIEQQSAQLIDARSETVFIGNSEKPGHIPTASNYFWQRHLNGHRLKSIEAIKNELQKQGYDHTKPYVHYCGSGISACVNFLIFDEAGYQSIKLYPGSFSDWSEG